MASRWSSSLFALTVLFPRLSAADSYTRDSYSDAEHSRDEKQPDEAKPAPKDDRLESQGLLPPSGDLDSEEENGAMAEELEQADVADSGRGLEYFWLSGDVGFSAFDIAAGARDRVLPGLAESGAGVAYGGGLGARLLYFSLGGRFRTINLPDYDVWTLGLELGIRFPLGALEPYTRFSVGYLGLLRGQTNGIPLSVSGFSGRVAGGADYYFSDSFSLGLELAFDCAAVSRAAVEGTLPASAPEVLRERVGSAALGGELMLNVGFHL
jgi:hypothetical protein